MINVTVWNEFRHEKSDKKVADIYPEGIHNAIASFLSKENDITVKTTTLDQEECGITDEILQWTDVLIWWSHMAHEEVSDEVVEKIQKSVINGMGIILLHSSHGSKVFRKLMGTTCSLRWREADEKERLWVIEPSHPIAKGLGEYFEIESTEMYGERFDIPKPDELIFLSWFEGGEVFRSGCTYYRGNGRVFYFRPGHETLPIYYKEEVKKVITNGVRWALVNNKNKQNIDNRNITNPIEEIKGYKRP